MNWNKLLYQHLRCIVDFNNKLLEIPISIDEGSLGKPLSVDIENNYITNIILFIHDKVNNFLEK